MNNKRIKFIGTILTAALWLLLAVWAWARPADDFSATERRKLTQFPSLEVKALLDGNFMSDFESYTLDQFPLRDSFRKLKALVHYKVLMQKDNNGIYLAENQAVKLEYPLNADSVTHAAEVFGRLREKYLQASNVFFSVVPDKGYYLAEANGYPAMDYETMIQSLQAGMSYANYVNLLDTLSAADYYATDTHWRQEKLLPAASRLCSALGIPAPQAADYQLIEAQRPFYGVYYGQAALPMDPDTLFYLQSDLLDACQVKNHETGKTGSIYDLQKLSGKDMYEVFLSGSVSLLTIENPLAETDRELIVFRDSFGSSMIPLLMQGYKTVTVIDIRYISGFMLDRFVDFHGQDVLFLYSTSVLNNSSTLQG